jgi:hypothetical protein
MNAFTHPTPHGVRYQPIGPIALKGVTTPVTLHAAVPTE